MSVLIQQVVMVAALMLAGVGFAWLTAYAIDAIERRLVGGLGLLFAGLYLGLRAADVPMDGVALAVAATGVVVLVRAGMAWRGREASRLWPVAAAVLIPSAFAGAVLLGGVLYSVLEGPARLAQHLALR